MEPNIPFIVESLYPYFVPGPLPEYWPDYLRNDPVRAHGLWSFYQGLRLGMQIADACLEKL